MPVTTIDISDENNFSFCYILIERLFNQYFSDSYLQDRETEEVIFGEFKEGKPSIKIEGFSKMIVEKSSIDTKKRYFDQKEIDRNSIKLSTLKALVNRIIGYPVNNPSKKGDNEFDEIKFDALCRLLNMRDEKGIEIKTWKSFIGDNSIIENKKRIAQLLKPKIERIKETFKPKILISVSVVSTVNDSDQLKQGILSDFRMRFRKLLPEDEIILKFDSGEKEIPNKDTAEQRGKKDFGNAISNEKEAEQRGKKNYADLVVWGHFSNERQGLKVDLNYLISSPRLKKRVSRNKHSYDVPDLSLMDLRRGGICTEIDHAILLILAIGALAKDNIEAAGEYIRKIPEDDRCDETNFILGNCHYLQGDKQNAITFWKTSIDKNSTHLRAKINLGLYQISQAVREKGRLDIGLAAEIKESLTDYDPNKESAEVSAALGVLFSEIGENEKAIQALQKALRSGKNLKDASYYHIKLGQLTDDIKEYKKAALDSEAIWIHKLCKDLIENSKCPEDQKNAVYIAIHNSHKNNPEIRDIYTQPSKDQIIPSDEILIYEIQGQIRKERKKHYLQNGDGLNYVELIIANTEVAKAVVLKRDAGGKHAIPARLFFSKIGEHSKVEDCLYNFSHSFKAINPDPRKLFLNSCTIRITEGKPFEKIRIVGKETPIVLDLITGQKGEIVLERKTFEPFLNHLSENFISIEIQKYTEQGQLYTIQENLLIIPEEMEFRSRISRISQYFDTSKKSFYHEINTYISDFFAPSEVFDTRSWILASDFAFELP